MSEFVIAASCVAALLLVILLPFFEKWRFEKRFPPISDDEFMQQCPPGTSRAVALKVRRIVAEQLGIEYERIHPSAHFVDDLGV
jgi:hypothetical protein